MKDKQEHIYELVASGRPASEVFRALLNRIDETSRSRLTLFHEVQQLFEISLGRVTILGAWDCWPDGRLTDADIDEKFADLTDLCRVQE